MPNLLPDLLPSRQPRNLLPDLEKQAAPAPTVPATPPPGFVGPLDPDQESRVKRQKRIEELEKQWAFIQTMPLETDPLFEGAQQGAMAAIKGELESLKERQTLGLGELTMVDKVRSAVAALTTRGVDTVTAPLTSTGQSLAIAGMDETQYREFLNRPPEEQREVGLGKSLDFLSQIATYAVMSEGGMAASVWVAKNQDLIRQNAEKQGRDAAKDTNALLSRLDNYEKANVIPGFWTKDLPGAVGTTGAIAAAAGAASVASGGAIPSWVVAGTLGSALGAEEGLNDALSHGATPSQAQLAAGVGALLGTTEAVPVTLFLNRIDQSTGGIISRRINQVFKQKLIGNALTEGLKGAFEEGLQEAVQTVGQDWTAAKTYDPERPVFGRVLEAGATGGGSGFVLSAVAGALGLDIRRNQQADIRADILRREYERVLGEPYSQSTEAAITRYAPFSPLLPAYRELQTRMALNISRMEEILKISKENTTLTPSEIWDELNARMKRGEVPYEPGIDFRRGKVPEELLDPDLNGSYVNFEVEEGLTPPERTELTPSTTWRLNPKQTTLSPTATYNSSSTDPYSPGAEIWDNGDGTFEARIWDSNQGAMVPIGMFADLRSAQLASEAEMGVLQEDINAGPMTAAEALEKQPIVVAGFDHYQKLGNQARLEIRNWKKILEGKTNPDERAAIEGAIAERENLLSNFDRLHKAEIAFAKEAKNVVAGIREKFFDPDTKIVLKSQDPRWGMGDETLGSALSSYDGKIAVVAVNFPTIANDPRARGKATQLRETLLHEIGHALLNQKLVDLQARVEATLIPDSMVETEIGTTSPFSYDTKTLYLARVKKLQAEAKASGKSPATVEDILLYQGIMQEYYAWVSQRLSDPIIERFRTISPPGTVSYVEETWGAGSKQRLPSQVGNTPYLLSFDEYIAENLARSASQKPFITENVRGFFQKYRAEVEKIYTEYANLPTQEGFTIWLDQMSLRGKLAKAIGEQADKMWDAYTFFKDPGKAKELGLDPESFKFHEQLDKFQRWWKWGLDITQLSRKNEHIEPLSRLVRLETTMKERVGRFLWRAHNTLRSWRKLGNSMSAKVSESFIEESLAGKKFTNEQLAARGLNDDAIAVYQQIRDDYAQVLDRMEKVLLDQVTQSFYNDPVLLEQETKRVREEVQKMREKPFSPFMRFGKYTIVVRAAETTGKIKQGQVLEMQAFDKGKERDRNMQSVRDAWAGEPVVIGKGYLTDAQRSLQGMPTLVLNALRKKLSDHGVLDEETNAALNEIAQENLPLDSIRRHWARKKKIKGFSLDTMRSYAAYMSQMASHLARIEMSSDLYSAVNDIIKDSKAIAAVGGDGTKRGQIAEMARDQLNYMLNPTNDWPLLRSVLFANHFWFNLKSALVNSTQILTGTYPYLAARFGDAKTANSMIRASKTLARYTAGRGINPEIAELFKKGQERRILDQSLATEIAVAQSSKSSWDLVPGPGPMRLWTKFSEIGAWPFATIEKMNRYYTAVAAFQLYKGQGYNTQQSIALALDAVQNSQHNYEAYARAKVLTGKLGANVFIFKTYLQKQLFLALGNNPESSRVLMMMLITAGLMGLPFAEDLADIFDISASKLKKELGWDNPKVQSRQLLRELLQQMDANPDLFMYGLAENSMGLGYLGDLTGWPIPELDLQSSLGMGNVIPGTEALRRFQSTNDLGSAALDAITEAGGAEASYMASMADALLSDNPDSWKGYEQSLPAFFKGLSRSGRYANRGGEFDSRGFPIAEFDMDDPQDAIEVYSQMLGFTPSSVSTGWESYLAQREIVAYYETWKRSVLAHYNRAKLNGDPEEIDLQMEAIRDYNRRVPAREMRISGEVLLNSLTDFYTQRARAGKEIPRNLNTLRLSREIQDLYREEP